MKILLDGIEKEITIDKSPKGVYKDFEDLFKEVVLNFKIKDKLNFRKDLENMISTIEVDKENDLDLYSYLFLKLVEKYGG